MKKIELGILVSLTAFAVLVGPAGAMFPSGLNYFPSIPDRANQVVNEHNPHFKIGTGMYVQDEIIVSFKGDTKPFRVIKVPASKVLEEVAKHKKRTDVIYAEPNYLAYALLVPNDPYYGYQWHLDNSVYGGIQTKEAWDISNGSGVRVAIVDTGVTKGTDLAGTCFVPGYDFVNNDSIPTDDNGHGTHVAGTVAQSTDNGLGVAGVAYGACLMPVKVLDSTGAGTYADVADGIIWAADHGAKIINLSLGGSVASLTLENAVVDAYNKGVTIVAAAGNDGSSTLSYPAAYDDYVIAVGATRYDETLSYYSNYGPSLDLVAPGGDLNVDQNNDGYGDGVLQQTFQRSGRSGRVTWGYYFFQGTSMAAPHVAGTAALVLANGNATTPDEVRAVLQGTAENLGPAGWDETYGWGLVDAAAALGYAPTPNTPPVADANGLYTGLEDEAVIFDGSGSYDPDGDTLSYQWDFGDGSTGTGVAPSHVYLAGGDYTVSLVVNDGRVNSEPSYTTASITEVNDPPIANAGSDQTVSDADGTGAETVTLDGSASSDPDGIILSYEWTEGTTILGATAVITYDFAVGTHTVTLTVTDNNGATAIDDTVITVTEKPALPTAYVNIELSKQVVRSWWRVTATITVTENDASGLPVTDATLEGIWNGAYNGNISGTTNEDGLVSFRTGFIRGSGTVTLTVDRIVKDGQEYILVGEITDSISN